jgi:hypothetical protein
LAACASVRSDEDEGCELVSAGVGLAGISALENLGSKSSRIAN